MKKIFIVALASIFLISCGNTKKLTAAEYKKEIDKIVETMAADGKVLDGTIKETSTKEEKEKFIKDFVALLQKNYNKIIDLKGPDSLKETEKEYDKSLKEFVDFYVNNSVELNKAFNGEKNSDEFTKASEKLTEVNKKLGELQTKINEEASKVEEPKKEAK